MCRWQAAQHSVASPPDVSPEAFHQNIEAGSEDKQAKAWRLGGIDLGCDRIRISGCRCGGRVVSIRSRWRQSRRRCRCRGTSRHICYSRGGRRRRGRCDVSRGSCGCYGALREGLRLLTARSRGLRLVVREAGRAPKDPGGVPILSLEP